MAPNDSVVAILNFIKDKSPQLGLTEELSYCIDVI